MRNDAEKKSSRCGRGESRIGEEGLKDAEVERIRGGEEKDQGRTEKLREIDEEVLIVWMKTVLREISGLAVVQEIVERCDYRRMADVVVKCPK